MAEIILTVVINKSIEIAGNLLFQEGNQLYWLKQDIDWLQREMRHIRSYIDDAKAKIVEGDSRAKNFLKDIQELADDVEDLLDELLPKILESAHKSKAAIGCIKTACIPSHSSFVHEFAKEIEKIKRRVAEIDRVRTTYNIMDTSENNDQHDYVPLDRRKLFLHVDETEVIGLDDDFSTLQAKLLDQDIRYGVISIVGMLGLGKTTLAKKLFRHVSDQFECSAITYVSQKPRVGEILLDIAKQVKLTEEEMKGNLEVNLRSLLKIKRYVILLDDIWNVEIWDDLKLIFPECDSKAGSKIIITSRNSNVGRYIGGNSSLHVLQPLNSEKSFELFTRKLFTFDDKYWANDPPNMESIGRDIVGRCGGIPLAIVVIAGMLRARERTEHAWNTVLKNMSQNIQDRCVKILALSYKDLPAALRPCFLYFGLFPEDHEIFAFDLTNMWIAEKFIVKSGSSRREVEDIAEDFLNDLVSRNLIQVSRRTFQGRILSCRIHDLLHNLCVNLARESNFFLTMGNATSDPSDVARLRRLSFYSGVADEFFSSYPKPKKLSALLCYTSSLSSKTNLKLLRVLSITISSNSYQIASIPDGIGNLSCLCYFKLWGKNFMGHMPRSILKLKHLLTLDIQLTSVRIDVDVMEMKQLRHLRLSQLPQLPAIVVDELDKMLATSFPFFTSGGVNAGNALLPNLQTLTGMDDFYMKARWLHQLTNLRKLSVKVSNKIVEVFSTPLAILPRLEVLKLYPPMLWDDDRQDQQINLSSYHNFLKLSLRSMDLKIVNFEAFPANLLKLSLSDVELDMYHIQMLKRLPKLVILKLYGCIHDYNVENLDMSGASSFQQLQVLLIIGSRGLLEVTVDELGMPKLNRVIVDTWVMLPERLEKLRHR